MRKQNFRKMSAGDFIEYVGIDAQRWARAFMAIHGDKLPDEANLIGWFANAIAAGQMKPDRRFWRKHK